MRNEFWVFSIVSVTGIALLAYFFSMNWLWLYVLILPIVVMGMYDMYQKKHAIMRNFPILGRGRYILEEWRPKLYQYFIESDTNGRPISRIYRSVVYQRAKHVLDTSPFGTQLDVYEEGYEWVNHSIAALPYEDVPEDPRVRVGAPGTTQPYDCSIFNVSAMSYGSLSSNAIEALNGGAAIGKFAHNTGEGGISPYHKKPGGDLIYQVGTGYFGCRAEDGNFDPEKFKVTAGIPQVKMIELKLSQGAKPGHGGILPAKKVTKEISEIRGVPMGQDVLSPPYHKAFKTPIELLELIRKMRELSGGKPVGFKLCVGNPSDFLSICQAMVATKIYPDFITVDGGEGGTGAAPLEFTNSVGMPFNEGMAFVHNALVGYNVREHIKLIGAGKIITGFHIFRAMALGADITYSARAMMLALGCIQALECNKNSCPTGVATNNPELTAGLVVSDKKVRVASYHHETVKGFNELLAATGLDNPNKIRRHHLHRRITMTQARTYEDIFPYLEPGSLLNEATVPETWKKAVDRSSPDRF